MNTQKLKGFTLVELIVVITILAVLATVAFISFQWYTSSSRDSVRLADLKNISKSFEINRTKGIDFPLPDKKVDIYASGALLQHQWELSQNILEKDLNIFDGGLDPVTKKPYWYATNSARNKFQIIWFLDNFESLSNISPQKIFADNSDKYAKSFGDNLAILLTPDTYEVIIDESNTQTIDIVNTSDDYEVIIGTKRKGTLQNDAIIRNEILPNTSCQKLFESGENESWVYTISPDGKENIQVYCKIDENGGWTLLAVYDSLWTWDWSISSSTNLWNWTNDSTFWTTNISNPYVNLEQKYPSYASLAFDDMMFVQQHTQATVLETSWCKIAQSMPELFTQTPWQDVTTTKPDAVCEKEFVTIDKSWDNSFYGTQYWYRNNPMFGGLNIKLSDWWAGNIADDFALITTSVYESGYIWWVQTRWDSQWPFGVSSWSWDWNDPIWADYGMLLFVK